MPIRVTGTLEEFFPEPEKFKPERWSRQNKDAINVFGSLPFGFGVRMCVGQLLQETCSVCFADSAVVCFVHRIYYNLFG